MRLRDLLGTTAAVAALAFGMALPASAQSPAPPAGVQSPAPPAGAQSPAPPAGAQSPAPAANQTPRALEGAEAMASHRAGYRLSLASVRPDGQIGQAEGTMAFEVRDACDGWTTRQRLALTVVDRSGQEIQTASDYSTWESKDGTRLRFTMTQSSQGAVTQRVSGEAELNGDQGGTVRYEEPAATQMTLPPGTILPMAHTIRTLALARAGQQRMLVVPLFDGTTAEGAQDSTTILSPWAAAQANPRFPLLANQASARMNIAFFSREASAGAGTPEYQVGLRYFANGIADDMKMDFGDFTLNGVLESLDALPHDC
jgi:hypothetical protein